MTRHFPILLDRRAWLRAVKAAVAKAEVSFRKASLNEQWADKTAGLPKPDPTPWWLAGVEFVWGLAEAHIHQSVLYNQDPDTLEGFLDRYVREVLVETFQYKIAALESRDLNISLRQGEFVAFAEGQLVQRRPEPSWR